MSIGNVVFYDSGNNAISTSGGTASASSAFGGQPASSAFTGDTTCASFWLANSISSGWLKMAFTGAVAVDHVGITYGCNGGRGFPVFLQLQYSDDDLTYATANEWDGVQAFQTTTTVFTSANALPASPMIWWRLSITGTGTCVGIKNLGFFPLANAGGSQIGTTYYSAMASTIFSDGAGPTGAFNGTGTSDSGYNSTSVAQTVTWTYAFPTLQTLGSIQFSNFSVGGCQQYNNLEVLYSLNGVSYISANTFTPTWTGNQTKIFNITGGPLTFVPQIGGFLVGF
jgi:hypothetical protein